MTKDRQCGDCTACCEYFPIKELGKAATVPCEKLANPKGSCNNCTIYNDRPKVCKEYACMWVAGYGAEEDRPDRCGILIDSMLPFPGALRGVPLARGNQDKPGAVSAIKRISKEADRPVMVCSYRETKLLRVVGRGAE